MKLLDRYRRECGAEVRKPFVYTKDYPIRSEKYITLNCAGGMPAKTYDLWKVVLDFLIPDLKEHGIDIVQLGEGNEPFFNGVYRYAGQLEYAQSAFIVKNALLHLGTDSSLVHTASVFDVPIVGLYSVSSPSICGPDFGNPDKQICLEPIFPEGHWYSFNPNDPQRVINTIKPERVIQAVCFLLGIESPKLETVRVGNAFHAGILEIIPNCILPNNVFSEMVLTVRYDKGGDEQAVYQQISQRKCVLVTDKPLNVGVLKQLLPHIERVVYLIGENDNPEFAKSLQDNGIPHILISRLSEEILSPKKLNYLEIGVIEPAPEGTRPEKTGTKFKTGKRIISNGKMYLSYAHVSADKPVDNPSKDTDDIIDSEEFWKQIEHYYLYE